MHRHASSRLPAAIGLSVLAAALCAGVPQPSRADDGKSAHVRLLAPAGGERAGVGGFGWFVDLGIDFDVPLAASGFGGFQLTGPGVHNNAAPFPGSFSPGRDDRLPGLIVLVSTTVTNAAFAGSCQNLANLFNLTGVTHREVDGSASAVATTWIVGAPLFGVNVPSTVRAAIAADRDGNGTLDDAPNVVPDADGNGSCDERDLKAFGLASNIAHANFFIAPPD